MDSFLYKNEVASIKEGQVSAERCTSGKSKPVMGKLRPVGQMRPA